eukprot:snap_masked-scaffold_2-processed-gene-22.9-mRNA-1 protein AED:1.00 eAED:1.00 QI:0/0/0/0/1/1/2/0/120
MRETSDQPERCGLNDTGSNPDLVVVTANRYFGLFYAILSWGYYITFTVLYLLRRRESTYLRKRLLLFVLIVTFGFVYEGIWGIREFVERNSFPCVLSEPGVPLTFAIIITPVVLRENKIV